MQSDIPYSLIVWDDINNLPFPVEVKNIIQNVKWEQFEWHVAGLPIPFAKYNMSGGKNLYLSELPNGEIKVEHITDFTGNVIMGGYFVDEVNPDGFNYFVSFIVTIVKGVVIEIKVGEVNKQPVHEYQVAMKEFQDGVNRVMKISHAWWFKWLYRPYFLVIRSVGFALLMILKFIKDCVILIVRLLTPL